MTRTFLEDFEDADLDEWTTARARWVSQFTPEIRRQNLDTLATFFETFAGNEQLAGGFTMAEFYFQNGELRGLQTVPPEHQLKYDQATAVNGRNQYRTIGPDEYSCKTAACAVGWTPYATGIPKPTGLNWYDYSFAVLYRSENISEVFEATSPWAFMFGPLWANVDDTAAGAAKRIRWFLKHDRAPRGYTYCYAHRINVLGSLIEPDRDEETGIVGPVRKIFEAGLHDRLLDFTDEYHKAHQAAPLADWGVALNRLVRDLELSA